MTVGHMFVGGGETPQPKKFKGGLLGADYSLENNRYRVAKVYNGENWNPGNEAPLTQPGVNVKARRLHSRGERARTPCLRQHLQLLRGDGREAGAC